MVGVTRPLVAFVAASNSVFTPLALMLTRRTTFAPPALPKSSERRCAQCWSSSWYTAPMSWKLTCG